MFGVVLLLRGLGRTIMQKDNKIQVGDLVSYIKGEDIHGWEEKGYGEVVSLASNGKTIFIREKNKYISVASHLVTIKKGE